jgi:GDSL-like Lipase/Acylhydrolase family
MVERYNPEYLLVLLGFNDILWGITGDGSGVLANMEKFVTLVRKAKPNMKFAIGNVPHRAPPINDLTERTDAYNKLLAGAIPRWSTELSPIELVYMRESFSCEEDGCPAGHDGLHPNTLGDYQIAQAFSRALIKGYKLGKTELAVPDPWDLPVRPISIPKNCKAVADAHGVNITWDAVYGARRYDVQSRVLGEQTWVPLPNQLGNKFYAAWPDAKAIEMEFQVRMNNGDFEKEGEWSRVIGTCRPWSSLTSEEKWDWRWWYRRFSACARR